jgi:hypothetical protein
VPSPTRIAYGDFQTPDDLAERALARVATLLSAEPRTVLEPTCGVGAFLSAAARRMPRARLLGYEIDARHAAIAASKVQGHQGSVHVADFFTVDWDLAIASMATPILVIGNPPWVTTSTLGALGHGNMPVKENWKRLRGLDALTGKSNFDVSEWMILRLLRALSGHDATLAMLCKSAVARRVIEVAAGSGLAATGSLHRIDALRHFGASVDAVLLVARASTDPRAEGASWPVYASLEAREPEGSLGVVDGVLIADLAAHARTRHLEGESEPVWRSGLKHDAARVMELRREGASWVNGLGEAVDVEAEHCYPWLKGTDVARARLSAERSVIVPQRGLGEDTMSLRERAPRLFAYLTRHRALLDARKSSIYVGRPPFSIFGVGAYAFAPWKVAVSGLHKQPRFTLVGPRGGRPVMLDDTCYFLPFDSEPRAERAARALSSDLAHDFFRARVFWDAKRPISKTVLSALDLDRLMRAIP